MPEIGRTVATFAAALAVMGGTCLAEDMHDMALVPSAAAVAWGPAPASLPKGAQLVVLKGDPGQPGPFVLRVKFPPNSTVGPHWHATAENLTVLSGTLFHGIGDTLDKGHGEAMEVGGFVYLPARMNHSVWTTGSEAVVQVTGTGPFGLNYVNPADDPSKSQ